MPCETVNNLRLTSPLLRVQPLALALALAFAGDASLAGAASATHAVPVGSRASGRPVVPKTLSSPRPDGSVLWSVDNCNDAGTGSLRDVAAHANHGDGIDLGALACSTISITSGAITLHDVEMTGPGAGQLEIDGTGNQGKRIFNHSGAGGTLSISGVTIRGGTYVSNAGLGGGCLRSTGGNLSIADSVFRSCAVVTPVGQDGNARGGAIAFYGTDVNVGLYGATIESSLARTDHGLAQGGGLYAQGDVVMRRSTIANNWVSASGSVSPFSGTINGGGLHTRGSVWIENSTLDGNTSSGDAGAAFVNRGGTLLNSTVSHNAAGSGTSGIVMQGSSNVYAHIYSSTISGNVSERSQQWWSGGLYLSNTDVTIASSTITGNSETNQDSTKFGAGIVFGQYAVNVSMSGTIVSGNYFDAGETSHAADDIDAPDTLAILGDTDLVGWSHRPVPADTIWEVDPRLGPLQHNGGPTQTHLPLPGSPAIDHGDAHGFDTDQRGYARVVGAAADIGSVESDGDKIFADGFEPFDPQ